MVQVFSEYNPRNNANCEYSAFLDAAYYIRIGSKLQLLYASLLFDKNSSPVIHAFNHFKEMMVRVRYGVDTYFSRRDTEMSVYHGRDGIDHVVFRRKEELDSCESRLISAFFMKVDAKDCHAEKIYNDEEKIHEDIHDLTYNAIMKNTSIPALREWMPYLCDTLRDARAYSIATCYGEKGDNGIGWKYDHGFKSVIVLNVSEDMLVSYIQKGLKEKKISIAGCEDISDTVRNINGLDDYQKAFGQILADHIKESFKPKYDPSARPVCPDISGFYKVCQYYTPEIENYEAQMHVIQATVNNLDKNQNTLISGQTGSGKTILGIGSVVCHAKKKNYAALVMCPPSLVTRWEEGIRKTVPFSLVRIVTNMKEFLAAREELRNPRRTRSIWVIMSENTAKANYEERPAVIWNSAKNQYVCPHCGKPIYIYHYRDRAGEILRTANRSNLLIADALDFLEQNEHNLKHNSNNNYGDNAGCKEKLWTAASKQNSKEWIKLPGIGWMLCKNISKVKANIEGYLSNPAENIPQKMLSKYHSILKTINDYENHGTVERYPNRYSIAHFMKKHMKNEFDYGIFDEVHELSGDSQQGNAFGDICNSVWKSIFLTGTLSNGYASGLFHLLFRTQTKKMLKDGFEHDSGPAFADKYGVKEIETIVKGRYRTIHGEQQFREDKKPKKKVRQLPGISPTLFADYLLDNTVFVTKKDIKQDLCKYTEHPVAVEMDYELRTTYNSAISKISSLIVAEDSNRHAVRQSIFQAAMFLDQPYGVDITDTGGKILELNDTVIRNKERELIRIVKERRDNGEKVLIYCEWTNKLNIQNRLKKLLEDEGINAAVMTTNVKTTERQKWLEQSARAGIDAVILHPGLVEVGLNLLDYTSIIFYEIGTKVITVRQASQRSNRINQEHPVNVYFLYYKDTIQEDMLGAISQKMKAATALEGDFSESALKSLTDDTDILTKLANSIVKNERIVVDKRNFESNEEEVIELSRARESSKSIRSTFNDRFQVYFDDFDQIHDNLSIA